VPEVGSTNKLEYLDEQKLANIISQQKYQVEILLEQPLDTLPIHRILPMIKALDHNIKAPL